MILFCQESLDGPKAVSQTLLMTLFADEVDSDFQSSEEDEVPFARHGPLLEADTEELSMHREF